MGDRHVVTRTTLSREPKAKVVFRRKTTFALNDHKTSLSIRVWLRAHTEVYTEVKQLGPGGRREFDVSIIETTFETSVWGRYFSALGAGYCYYYY